MKVRVVDKDGREVPESEAKALFEALGFEELWHTARAAEDVVRVILVLSKRGVLEERGGGFAGAIAPEGIKGVRVDVSIKREGASLWEVEFALPFEYSGAAAFAASVLCHFAEALRKHQRDIEHLQRMVSDLGERVLQLERSAPSWRWRKGEEEEEEVLEEEEWEE